jgi:hypothetical protein
VTRWLSCQTSSDAQLVLVLALVLVSLAVRLLVPQQRLLQSWQPCAG